jgi:hypothetical protein
MLFVAAVVLHASVQEPSDNPVWHQVLQHHLEHHQGQDEGPDEQAEVAE